MSDRHESGAEAPRIAILLATYEPELDWLREQLDSLNAQTYPNLHLYVRDDCSSVPVYERLRALLRERITAFPYELRRNEVNLGSNLSFERLTLEAEGSYFAYCDQDDIWLPDKLRQYEQVLRERPTAPLVCSDMYIMDQTGELVADSMTKIRRHHVFREGGGLAGELLFSNFVTGCAMMVRSAYAKAAIPFCPYMVHDQYLAFFCARLGEIALIRRPLIRYRVHGRNQTREMAGVVNKDSYYRERILPQLERLQWLKARFGEEAELRVPLERGLQWVSARKSYYCTGHGAGTVWKYRRFGRNTALLELVARYLPERPFMAVIALKRKNLI